MMDIANRIVFELVGPSKEASYLERLENRPDWQRYVGLVRMMIDDELFDLRNERDEWKELHRRDLANELHQQARAEAAEARLRALWQRAIDADLLDDPHELEAAIVEASKLLNYPRTLPEDD